MPLMAYRDRGCSSTHLVEVVLPSKLPDSAGYLNSGLVPKERHLCFPEDGPQFADMAK